MDNSTPLPWILTSLCANITYNNSNYSVPDILIDQILDNMAKPRMCIFEQIESLLTSVFKDIKILKNLKNILLYLQYWQNSDIFFAPL